MLFLLKKLERSYLNKVRKLLNSEKFLLKFGIEYMRLGRNLFLNIVHL